MMTKNGTTDTVEVANRIEALEKAQAAAHVGTWATMGAGSIALIVGMFLGLTIASNNRDRA
jgi:hypothetical protein